MKGSRDHFWVTKINQNDSKSLPKCSQNRCLEGVWVVPGRLLAPDGFRGGSRDAPRPPTGASWVAFAAPNGAMLGARCAPRGLRKRKKIGSFSHGPRRSVFLKIWWFWVVKRVDFECQSGAKLAFKLKTCKRLPALRFLQEFHRFLVSRGYVFGQNSTKKR